MLIEALRGEAVRLVNRAAGVAASGQKHQKQRPSLRNRVGAAFAVAGAALLLSGGIGSAARAQTIDNGEQRDFAVKVGIYSPSEKYIRSATATYIPMIEGDYTIQKYPESHFNSVLSLGYMEHGALRMIPLTVSQIYRDPNNAAGVNYYYGLGVGIYQTRLNLSDTSDKVKNLAGGFIVVGLDLTRTAFAELKYHYISPYDQKRLQGTQGSIGLRF